MECGLLLAVLELFELDGIDRRAFRYIIDLLIYSQLGLMPFTYSRWFTYKVSNFETVELLWSFSCARGLNYDYRIFVSYRNTATASWEKCTGMNIKNIQFLFIAPTSHLCVRSLHSKQAQAVAIYLPMKYLQCTCNFYD